MAKNKDEAANKKILRSVLENKTEAELLKAREFLTKLLDYKKAAKLYDTYVKGTRKAIEFNNENKVFCEYRISEVVTGRLSCASYSAGRGNKLGVSFHTLPRETKYNIRKLFCAPDGYWFITADYGAMEMRFMAHASGDKNMLRAFLSGEDLHSYTASLVFNKPISQITKHERQLAKATSFLIIYGGGANTLAGNAGITVAAATQIIADYEQAFPDVFTYMAECEKIVKETGEIPSIFGRVRHLPNIRSKNIKIRQQAIRQGINSTIQSSSSDILLMALNGATRDFHLKSLDARNVGIVHDSIETVTNKDCAVRAMEVVYDNMVNNPEMRAAYNIDFEVPFDIDMEIGHSFGDGASVKFVNGKVTNEEEILEYFNGK